MSTYLTRYHPIVLSLLRVAAALLFLEHGLMKLIQFPLPQPGVSYPLSPVLLVAGLIEAIGGVLLLIGFLTRPVAFVASGEMAVAYFMAHAPRSFWPAVNEGDAAVLYCFIFLYLVFAGAGSISIDARRSLPTAPPC